MVPVDSSQNNQPIDTVGCPTTISTANVAPSVPVSHPPASDSDSGDESYRNAAPKGRRKLAVAAELSAYLDEEPIPLFGANVAKAAESVEILAYWDVSNILF